MSKAGVSLLVFMFMGAAFLLFAKPVDAQGSSFPGWLDSYWFRPIPPQGVPPEKFSALEASLMPEDCGNCHKKQFDEWKLSRHASAMEEGVAGQFQHPWLDKDDIISCQECHAPLYEQKPFIRSGGEVIKNRFYSDPLRQKGIVCAVCHLRKHIRHGPPPRKWVGQDAPHNGFKIIEDFNRSEFCKSCHQFDPGDRRLNGKLIQDTYEQWKRSRYAKQGVQCADCHMPDRQHLFAGIHSAKMVREGLTIRLISDATSATAYITNSGAGHMLPTYMTSRIAVIGKVLNSKGELIEGTVTEYSIQWMSNLAITREEFDTRLAPDETFTARFGLPDVLSQKGNFWEIEVRVFPDEFYRRFFEMLLKNPPKEMDMTMIGKALKNIKNSDYSIYNRKLPF